MKLRHKRSSWKQENGTHRVDSDREINGSKIEGSRKLSKKKLIDYESLPDYMKDNEFIRDHYRCEWPLNDVALSVFSVHNETINIWTHLIGFLIFAWFTAVSMTEAATVENLVKSFFRLAGNGPWISVNAETMNGSDALLQGYNLSYIHIPSISHMHATPDVIPNWPWFIFLGGAMCCLILSSASHLFACHSKRFHHFFWRLDYVGITVMIIASFISPIFYTFACHPCSCLFYLTGIISAGMGAVVTLLSPALSSGSRYRSFRAGLFVAMGFSGVIPAAHALVLFWGRYPQIRVALGYEVLMGVLYASGAGFYVSRFPERWRPGLFDVVGHSHQIFHVFVVAAALAHCKATLVIMDWRRGLPIC